MEHGTYVCVVVAHICKNKTFVPTVVIFKRWRRKICACGRAPWRPAHRSFSPSLCKQNGTKNDKKRACSLLVSHSTPTSAKSFVIALPLILRSLPCYTRENTCGIFSHWHSIFTQKRSRLESCILSPEKKIINCYQQTSRATQVC